MRDTFGILSCCCRFQTFPTFVHVITSVLPQSIYHLLHKHIRETGREPEREREEDKKQCSMCLKRNPPLKQKGLRNMSAFTISLCLNSQSDASALSTPVWDRPCAYETNLLSMNPADMDPVWFYPSIALFVYTS